jgi:hypothetical protein
LLIDRTGPRDWSIQVPDRSPPGAGAAVPVFAADATPDDCGPLWVAAAEPQIKTTAMAALKPFRILNSVRATAFESWIGQYFHCRASQ